MTRVTAEEEQSEDSVIAESVVAALGFEPTRPLTGVPSKESVDAIVEDLLSNGDDLADDDDDDVEMDAETDSDARASVDADDASPDDALTTSDGSADAIADDLDAEAPDEDEDVVDADADADTDAAAEADETDLTDTDLADAGLPDPDLDLDADEVIELDDVELDEPTIDLGLTEDDEADDDGDAVDALGGGNASDPTELATQGLFDQDTPAVDADDEPEDLALADADLGEDADLDAEADIELDDSEHIELELDAPGTDGLFPDLPGPGDEVDERSSADLAATDILAPGAFPEVGEPVEAPLVESPAVAATAAASAAVPAGRRFGRRRRLRARKVRRVIRHIDPWSVLTFSVLFHLALFTALLLAGVLLWNAAIRAGTVERVESFIEQIGDYEAFEIDSAQIFRSAVIIGATLTLASSVLLVLLTVVFNLISDLIGGIRVTVIEEETVQLRPKKRRRRWSDTPAAAESG